jgi:hypothetical protein
MLCPDQTVKDMSLTRTESFHARLQTGNKVQIPVLIRWKNKLEPGEVFRMEVSKADEYKREKFYVRLGKDGRIVIPKLTVERLGSKHRDVLSCILYVEK